MIVNNGKKWIRDLIQGKPEAAITHLAIGDSGAPVSEGDNALANEVARKAITGMYEDTEVVVIETYWDRYEANFTWREVGLFAGGTDDPGTGTLIARALVYEEKDDMKTATVIWEFGFINRVGG